MLIIYLFENIIVCKPNFDPEHVKFFDQLFEYAITISERFKKLKIKYMYI